MPDVLPPDVVAVDVAGLGVARRVVAALDGEAWEVADVAVVARDPVRLATGVGDAEHRGAFASAIGGAVAPVPS